jgi:hypothetical protein
MMTDDECRLDWRCYLDEQAKGERQLTGLIYGSQFDSINFFPDQLLKSV